MQIPRRTVLSAALPAVIGSSGCLGLLSSPNARPVVTSGATVQGRYVVGQPTLEDAPVAVGYLATQPEGMDEILRWSELIEPQRRSLRSAQDRFEPGNHFFTAVLGVLPWAYGLTDYKDARLDDGVMRYYTKPYNTNVDTQEPGEEVDPNDRYPDYHYDYTFTLWKLRDGIDAPDSIAVNFRPGPIATTEAPNLQTR